MKKLLVTLAIASVFLTACGQQNAEDAVPKSSPMKINVVQPKSTDFAKTLTLTGSWVARDTVVINAALQGQQITAVLADVGQRVKKGQVLATLENTNVQTTVQQNQANLAKAKANLGVQAAALKEAETTLQRYQALVGAEAISRLEFDQQKAKADTARASVQAARAEIAQIEAQLADSQHQRSKAEIVAPADGIITARNAEKGTLTDSNALFQLAKHGTIELEAQANSDELAQLQSGLQANLKNKDIGGQIRLIYPEMDAKTRLGKVRIAFDDTSGFAIGEYGEVQISLPMQNANLVVPFSAVSYGDNGLKYLMIVNKQGEVERREVSLGSQFQDWVEVLSGVNADEQIVQKATAFVSAGDKVEAVLVRG